MPMMEKLYEELPDVDVRDLFDLVGSIRYGAPTSEKERLAISGSLPGAPEDRTAEQDAANRYAAGYLFAKEHPRFSRLVQPLVDAVKTSDLPWVGGSTPELQSYASHGATRAREDYGSSLADLLGE